MNRGQRGAYPRSRPSRPPRRGGYGGDYQSSYGGGMRGQRGGFGGGYRGDRGRGRGGGFRGGFGRRSPPRTRYPPPTENEKHIFRKGNGDHYPHYNKPAGPLSFKKLSEPDVGITEYISKHEGFNGIIKQRFSDFHVNEIDSFGNIVVLNNLDVPELKRQESVTLEEALPKDTVDKLRTLLTDFGRNNTVEIDVSSMPKDERKRIHIAIRGEFGDKLNSNTKTNGESKILVIARSDKMSKQDVRLPWPEDRPGKFLHFILYKENFDTMEAVNYIASRFKMNPSMVNYAGTKDKRAMTSQLVSMYKVEPARLVEKCAKQKRITFGNFEFKTEPLKLGTLQGNRFRITLRNVMGTDDQIKESMTSLKENGFINYYGLQRFGNSSEVPTYEIGRELLLGHWRKAVELILKPRKSDSNMEVNHARQVWWSTGNANEALNSLNWQEYTIEGKLLAGLVRRGASNYMDALENIPRNTRLLYLHAYQSLIWNKIVSRRIQELGMKPIVGDLVLLDDIKSEVFFEEQVPSEKKTKPTPKEGEPAKAKEGEDNGEKQEAKEGEDNGEKQEAKEGEDNGEKQEAKEGEDNGEKQEAKESEGSGSDSAETKEISEVEGEKETKTEDVQSSDDVVEVAEDDADKKDEDGVEEKMPKKETYKIPEKLTKRPEVKILTEEELPNYTLRDIVFPLPGFDIVFPENCVKKWYEDFLKEDGLTFAGMKQKVRRYSLGGAYRKMIIVPENFTWHTMRYSDPDKPLILSDLEKLNKVAEPVDEVEGTYKALLLDFQLPSSAYATMALREILKQDTSTSYQATLNTYHDKKAKEIESQKRKENEEGAEELPSKKAKVDEGSNGEVEDAATEDAEGGEEAEEGVEEVEVEEEGDEEEEEVMEVEKSKAEEDNGE